MQFQILDTGIQGVETNMSVDAELLANLKEEPILHLYDWAGSSLTYGYFIDLPKHLNLQAAAEAGLKTARRPTGGGIVFHLWDLAFSFLLPASHPACSKNTLENYQFVNGVVLEAFEICFSIKGDLLSEKVEGSAFCMAAPTIYDAVYQGMKIAGAAQRRTKLGYLHQGTISLAFPDLSLLTRVLVSKKEVMEAIAGSTFAPLGKNCTAQRLKEARDQLQKELVQKFRAKL